MTLGGQLAENEAPNFGEAAPYTFQLEENRPGRPDPVVVGTVQADDPNEDDKLTYAIISESELFKIDSASGVVSYVGPGEDHESASKSYVLEVTATDDLSQLSDTAEVTVEVIDEHDETVQSRLTDVSKAILPEASRGIVSGVIDAVSRRIKAALDAVSRRIKSPGADEAGQPQYSIAGYSSLHQALKANERSLQEGTMDWEQALLDSSFSLGLGETDDGTSPDLLGSMTFWGGGDWRTLSAGDDHDPVEWKGNILGARLGLDTQLRSDLLAGLTLNWSRGSFDWTSRAKGAVPIKGTHETRMTSLHPYVGWSPSEDASLWASVGYGWGEVDIDDDDVGQRSSDSTMQTGALGGHARVFSGESLISGGTTSLTLKGETWMSRFKLEGDGSLIEPLTVNAQRLRLGLEGSHERQLADGSLLTPSVEVSLRHNGGDGETGAGVELGAGLAWTDATRGLAVEGRLHTLVAQRSDLKEWGISGSVRLNPGADGRGLSLSLTPSWGATERGAARLWENGPTSDPTGKVENGEARLQAEIGYGLSAIGERGVLTPYGGLSWSNDGARDYRLGARLEIGPSLTLGLEGERRERTAGVPNNVLMLRGTLNW